MTSLTDIQAKASAPHNNIYLTASAGTGKTHVLIARLIRLMLAGAAPESLLCLTFTKAAAAQMKTRLFKELAQWTNFDPEALRHRLKEQYNTEITDDEHLSRVHALFAQALDLSDRLRIQTFHSFCQSLLGRFPLEAGLLPGFEAIEEGESQRLLAEARDITLRRSLETPALEKAMALIARKTTEHSFKELMDTLRMQAGTLSHGLRYYQGSADRYCDAMEQFLGVQGETVESLAVQAFNAWPLGPADTVSLIHSLKDGTKTDETMANILAKVFIFSAAEPHSGPAVPAISVPDISAPERFSLISGWFLTAAETPRKNLITKGCLKKYAHLEDMIKPLTDWHEKAYDRIQHRHLADQSSAIIRIGVELLTAYETEKRRLSLVDFQDMVDRSVSVIAGQRMTPWVLFKMDGEISHILIDEAQDTNPDQWRVVVSLAEEFYAGEGVSNENRTIFAVGDEKQSIFSFQGADPEQFLKARQELSIRARAAGKAADTITMDLSFRSTRGVLDVIDRLFTEFPAAAHGVVFDSKTLAHQTARVGDGGKTTLWPLFTDRLEGEDTDEKPWVPPLTQSSKISAEQEAAVKVALNISERLKSGEILPAKGRPIHAGDFLVLVRRRKLFTETLTRYLQFLGVPVAGRDRMKLTEEQPVMDLLALAGAALTPDDDVTLATVLKGPFIGLSEDGLFRLAHNREKKSLYQQASQHGDDPEIKQALQRFIVLTGNADQVNVYDFFAAILEQHKGRAFLVARLGEEIHEPVNALLEAAMAFDRMEAGGLYAFLALVNRSGSDVKRELDQEQKQVRIMTVHSAKGLQAPIVYLADTTTTPHMTNDNRLVTWFPPAGPSGIENSTVPFLLWTDTLKDLSFVTALKQDKKESAFKEYNRLLYVAMTRAEDQLIVVGWKGERENPEGCWYNLIKDTFDCLVPETEAMLDKQIPVVYECPQERTPSDMTDNMLGEMSIASPGWLFMPPPQETMPPNPLRPSDISETFTASPLDLIGESSAQKSGGGYRIRGQIIHKILEWLPDCLPSEREKFLQTYLEQEFGAGAETEALTDKIIQLFALPETSMILSSAGRSEVPLTGLIGQIPISGRIDRLLVSDKEIVFADFKTGFRRPGKAENIPADTYRQMALYSGILRQIYPNRHIKALLIYTEGPDVFSLDPRRLATYLGEGLARSNDFVS